MKKEKFELLEDAIMLIETELYKLYKINKLQIKEKIAKFPQELL